MAKNRLGRGLDALIPTDIDEFVSPSLPSELKNDANQINNIMWIPTKIINILQMFNNRTIIRDKTIDKEKIYEIHGTDMYNILKNPNKTIHLNNSSNNDDYTLIDLLPTSNESSANAVEGEVTMKNELKNFLKKQLHEPSKSEYLPLEANF